MQKLVFWIEGSTYCLVGDDQLDHRQGIEHSDGDDVPVQAEGMVTVFKLAIESLLFLKMFVSYS